jgi:PIN domain nuclease of toxin-antitoxin system
MLNLDTHILVFALADQLRPKERDLLSRERWGVSAIVLWELAKLYQMGRIEVDLEDLGVIRASRRSMSGRSIWRSARNCGDSILTEIRPMQ